MKITSLNKYLLIGVFNKLVNFYTGRCVYAKAAFFSIGAVAVIGSSSLLELVITEFIKPNFFSQPTSTNGNTARAELLKFVLALLLLSMAVYFLRLSNKNQKARIEASKLVFEKNTWLIAEIRQSRIHAFCGSITQISGIEIVVTSENTDLNLGAMTSTSVSGRIRNLAATRSVTDDVIVDNVANFIQNWKISQNKFGNFNLGLCIECSNPFEAAEKGIKTIIFAVAIKKNPDGTSTIDESAINKIVSTSIDTAIRKDQRTVFLPLFGLGSGNVPQSKAIKIMANAVKAKLSSTGSSIDVYLGVYRADDLAELCISIT